MVSAIKGRLSRLGGSNIAKIPLLDNGVFQLCAWTQIDLEKGNSNNVGWMGFLPCCVTSKTSGWCFCFCDFALKTSPMSFPNMSSAKKRWCQVDARKVFVKAMSQEFSLHYHDMERLFGELPC